MHQDRQAGRRLDAQRGGDVKDTVDSRALKIAAEIMQAAGLCRHESPMKCKKIYVDGNVCSKCIKAWLIAKAKKELKKEDPDGLDNQSNPAPEL